MAREKVAEIFRELVGDRADKLSGSHFPADAASLIGESLAEGSDTAEQDLLRLHNVGFHLVDWQSEAAFIVALVLYPERFTKEEVKEGVDALLLHAPAHVLEAARLAGYETRNIFEEGDNETTCT